MTRLQAFNAMKMFLESYYRRTLSDDLGSMLGDLQFFEDGCTVDPAAWWIWEKCIKKVSNDTSNKQLTEIQAFNAMSLFLEHYYATTLWDDIGLLLRSIPYIQENTVVDPNIWKQWESCTKKALELGEYRELICLKKE
jgi:hypothetical protein